MIRDGDSVVSMLVEKAPGVRSGDFQHLVVSMSMVKASGVRSEDI